MSFLFKSKKPAPGSNGIPPSARKITSRDGLNGAPQPGTFGIPPAEEERARSGSGTSASPQGLMNPRSAPSPTPGSRHVVPRGQPMENNRQAPRRPQTAPSDTSLYPWSNQRLGFYDNFNPYPRYGAATNMIASKDGEIYSMGGLTEGSTVKGDMWIVEAGSQPMSCYQIETSADGPGPRVGHASLLIGNAFIVFGGDTKIDPDDVLDDTLYLLNTATKHWSRVAPLGPRPTGRYGHTLNILGSKIYVFGGQVDGFFFNDLVAFDLNALQTANSHWETLVQNSADGGPPQGQIPPGRTNHTMVTYDDKLYLFGGTNGAQWFNDVWVYDPRTNAWTSLDCIGFIPAPREGHAASIVDDVMYTFGGRNEDGKDYGDVAGFRIPTRRWYTFQNMGPSPSPRSGHGMTTFDKKIVVTGGEPSHTGERNEAELCEVYVLDTAKIRYPEDKAPVKAGVTRRPSVTDRSGTPQQDRTGSRDGSVSSQQGNRPLATKGSQDSMASNNAQYQRPQEPSSAGYVNGIMHQRPTRSAPSPVPGQLAPQPAQQARTNGIRPGMQSNGIDGRESPRLISKLDKIMAAEQQNRQTSAPNSFDQQRDRSGSQPDDSYGRSQSQYNQQPPPPTQQMQQQQMQQQQMQQQQPQQQQQQQPTQQMLQQQTSQQQYQQQSIQDTTQRRGFETPETGNRADDFIQSAFKQPAYADSGVGSSPALSTQQPDSLSKEVQDLRSKNAWYEAELGLAKKAGYRSSSLDSPSSPFDDKTAGAFGDEEKPLLEALLRTRAEIVQVQQALESQSASAAERIAQVEREKEAAVAEALYTRTQLSSRDSTDYDDGTPSNRLDEAHRRLASTLDAHSELKMQNQQLSQALAAERQARETAEASADAAHDRVASLDSHKQWSAPEIENLRAQLSESQRNARDLAEKHADAFSSSRSLDTDKRELTSKLTSAQENQRNHAGILSTLREAVQASNDKTALIETQLDSERQHRSGLEEKLLQLRADHERSVSELDSTSRQLQDARDLAERHAVEARTHREAVLAGLGQSSNRDLDAPDASDERVAILQQQVEEASARASSLKQQADSEAEQRRRAEERIAGLEAFQEQQNRESLTFRRQLQGTTRENTELQSSHAELQQQLSKHKLDIAAWEMHHEALKGALNDRGIDTSSLSRDINGQQSDDSSRMQQLEEQIEASSRSQEQMRQMYEERENTLKQSQDGEYRKLERECQSMRGTIDKLHSIATQMKKELEKQKDKNRSLKEETDELRRSRSASSNDPQSAADFEQERSKFRQLVDNLQTRLQKAQGEYNSQVQELQTAMSERDNYQEQSQHLQRELEGSKASAADLESLRAENQDLRTRTVEAERKVQMMLDTVGSNIDTYRRQSQSIPSSFMHADGPAMGSHDRGLSVTSLGGESTYSSHSIPNGNEGGRNSYAAMEAMMNELDTLRGDMERQRSGYNNRMSGISVLDGPGPTATAGDDSSHDDGSGRIDSLADMRRRHLSFNDDDEEEGRASRAAMQRQA